MAGAAKSELAIELLVLARAQGEGKVIPLVLSRLKTLY